MRALLTSLFCLAVIVPVLAQEKKEPPKKDAKGEALPAPAALEEDEPAGRGRPPVEIILVPGAAQAVPYRRGVSYANGGAIVVTQPEAATIVVTMSGLAACNADLICKSVANYQFDLHQDFEVCINSRRVKAAKLTLEGRVIGILRTDHSHYSKYLPKCRKGGTAQTQPAVASVSAGPHEIVALHLPARSTCCGDDLSIYNRDGPLCVPVVGGKYTLHETWGFGTTHIPFHVRGASAEFAPRPEYFPDTYWFQEFKIFNGEASKDFGFQVTLKVVSD